MYVPPPKRGNPARRQTRTVRTTEITEFPLQFRITYPTCNGADISVIARRSYDYLTTYVTGSQDMDQAIVRQVFRQRNESDHRVKRFGRPFLSSVSVSLPQGNTSAWDAHGSRWQIPFGGKTVSIRQRRSPATDGLNGYPELCVGEIYLLGVIELAATAPRACEAGVLRQRTVIRAIQIQNAGPRRRPKPTSRSPVMRRADRII
ncbi:hypothetical protein Bbelb_007700 [Branchiostoma belcheri]|nr:hypothetical protein Bbelb_007700 [Branchiostoma belcheri]